MGSLVFYYSPVSWIPRNYPRTISMRFIRLDDYSQTGSGKNAIGLIGVINSQRIFFNRVIIGGKTLSLRFYTWLKHYFAFVHEKMPSLPATFAISIIFVLQLLSGFFFIINSFQLLGDLKRFLDFFRADNLVDLIPLNFESLLTCQFLYDPF